MEYAIFAGAALMLAIGFPHWEPNGRFNSHFLRDRLLGLTGIFGHLGGTTLIGWMSGLGPGAVAFLGIPAAASVVYSLVVRPLVRANPVKRPHTVMRINTRAAIRQA